MRNQIIRNRFRGLLACVCVMALCVVMAGCGAGGQQAQTAQEAEAAQEAESVQEPAEPQKSDAARSPLANGTYDIEVETDSSMFRAQSCSLAVEDGAYTATLSLPGEGFSRLYFGSAEDAATAADEDVYDYYLNDDGLYTFDLPVSELDEELPIAAFGQRRDTWYDHTITFHAPSEE